MQQRANKISEGTIIKILPPDEDQGKECIKRKGRFFEVIEGYETFNEILLSGNALVEVIGND